MSVIDAPELRPYSAWKFDDWSAHLRNRVEPGSGEVASVRIPCC